MTAAALVAPRPALRLPGRPRLMLPDRARCALVGVRRALLATRPVVAAASGTSPTVVATNLYLRYGAWGESYADGAAVGTMTDQTGNSRNATQATAGAKPTYKTAIVNGHPVYRLDGGDYCTTATLSLAQPNTIWFVAKRRVSSTVEMGYCDGNGTTRHLIATWNGSATSMYLYAGSVSAQVTLTPENWHILAVTFNGASSKVWVNGGAGTTLSPGTQSLGAFTVGAETGGTSQWDGDIAEVLLYTGTQSFTDLDTNFSALGAYYGVSVSPTS